MRCMKIFEELILLKVYFFLNKLCIDGVVDVSGLVQSEELMESTENSRRYR